MSVTALRCDVFLTPITPTKVPNQVAMLQNLGVKKDRALDGNCPSRMIGNGTLGIAKIVQRTRDRATRRIF
jgi:hypothetical protein